MVLAAAPVATGKAHPRAVVTAKGPLRVAVEAETGRVHLRAARVAAGNGKILSPES